MQLTPVPREDDAVFTYEIDSNAVCVGWACDEPAVRDDLIDTARDGYAGAEGKDAVVARVSEWLLHATEAIEDSDLLDEQGRRFGSVLLNSILQNERIVDSIGALAEAAALETKGRSYRPRNCYALVVIDANDDLHFLDICATREGLRARTPTVAMLYQTVERFEEATGVPTWTPFRAGSVYLDENGAASLGTLELWDRED